MSEAINKKKKKFKKKRDIFLLISVLLTYLPFLAFFIYGCVTGSPRQKIGMSAVMIFACMFALIAIFQKHRLRSLPWLLLIGLVMVVKDVLPMIAIITVCILLDEFLVHPLYKKYKKRVEWIQIKGEVEEGEEEDGEGNSGE